MYEYKVAFETISNICEGSVGNEVKKLLKTLSSTQVKECADIIEKYEVYDQEDIYVLLSGSVEDLKLKDIAKAENKLDAYAELLRAKENKSDVYDMFKRKNLTRISKKYYRSEIVDKKNMPRQGWIINISAKGYYDYRKVVLNIVPDLVKMKACFKVVTPECYSGKIENVITIYSTGQFNFANFTKKSQLLLLDDINIQTNKYLFGRLSAIFQNFFGTRIIDASGFITDLAEGSIPNLPKHLEPMDILNYHEKILQKYKDSEDLVQYLQEFLIGISCHKEKIFYNVYLIESKNIEKVKQIPIFKDNEDINAICEFKVVQPEKVYYVALIVHDIYDDEMVRTLIREEINYKKLKKTNEETSEEREERKKKEQEKHEEGRRRREERSQRDKERYENEQYQKQKYDVSKKYNSKKKK